MKFFGIFILLAASFLSSEAIFNGHNLAIRPYMARIQYLTVQFFGGQGGGSVISNRHILTSSFVLNPTFIIINVFVGGITRETQFLLPVQARIMHPNYQANPRLNDIGIIVLGNEIIFNSFVQPIALAASFAPLENELGTALGFGGFPGQTNQMNLQAAFLRVVSSVRCLFRHPLHSAAQQFCAEDVRLRSDICSDDIAGPFILKQRGVDVLVGVASIHICHVNLQIPSEPSLFTRVSSYRTWIDELIQI